MEARCSLCRAEGGLARRSLRTFYTAFMLFSRLAECEGCDWVCHYCWVRARQCIQFLECARDSELVLGGAGLRVEPTVFPRYSMTHNGMVNVCDQDTCQDLSNLSFRKEGGTQSDSETKTLSTDSCAGSNKPQTLASLLKSEPDIHIPEEFHYRCFDSNNLEIIKETDSCADSNETDTLTSQLKKEPDIHIPVEFDYRCFDSKSQDIIKEISAPVSTAGKQAPASVTRPLVTFAGNPGLAAEHSKNLDLDKTVGAKSRLGKLEAEFLQDLDMELIIISREEQLKELAQIKLSAKYLSSKYRCDKCGFATNEENTYDNHQLRHNESAGSHECSLCARRFKSAHTLKTHLNAHARSYRCLRCGVIIKERLRCGPHHDKCTGSAPLECAECGKMCPTSYALKRHEKRTHKTVLRYQCDHCGHKSKTKCSLVGHMRAHSDVRRYPCDSCGKRFKSAVALTCHIKTHESGPNKKSDANYCVECDRVYNDKHSLLHHLKTSLKHVARDTFKFVCGECSRRFCTSTELKRHVDSFHRKERRHRCTLCEKVYAVSNGLSLHMQTAHAKVDRPRNHVCNVCGKGFHSSTTLKCHVVAVHFKERPFACQLCPATFGFKAALFTHNKLKHKKQTRAKEQANST